MIDRFMETNAELGISKGTEVPMGSMTPMRGDDILGILPVMPRCGHSAIVGSGLKTEQGADSQEEAFRPPVRTPYTFADAVADIEARPIGEGSGDYSNWLSI